MLTINRDKCGYCGTCVAVCPEDALELIDAYLSLERECIACGICARACPPRSTGRLCMKNKYDMLIVGGGPAGAIAARTAAEAGNSVCLIEKRPAIGTPIRCAEGISKDILEEFVKPDRRWISADIERARIIAPNGTTVRLEQNELGNAVGYILDRKVFDRELVWQAAEAGADVLVKTRATAPIMKNGVVQGAKVVSVGTPAEIRADVVLAADGTRGAVRPVGRA